MGKWGRFSKFSQRILTVNSSQGRWGVLSTFISVATFLVAMALSIYAVWGECVMGVAIFLGIVGLVIGLGAIAIGVLWFIQGTKDDPTDVKLDKINRTLGDMKSSIDDLPEKIATAIKCTQNNNQNKDVNQRH